MPAGRGLQGAASLGEVVLAWGFELGALLRVLARMGVLRKAEVPRDKRLWEWAAKTH